MAGLAALTAAEGLNAAFFLTTAAPTRNRYREAIAEKSGDENYKTTGMSWIQSPSILRSLAWP